MEFIATSLPDLYIIQPRVFADERGYFFESFRQNLFDKELGINPQFVQDNESLSQKGVLRGLHFQNPPHAQGKLVRVVQGAVRDVAVDIRSGMPTYGRHESIILSAGNKTMLWIPPGFAHGFVTLENDTIFQYKCTAYYHKESEGAIKWNDEHLNINWGIDLPIVSEKDQVAEAFSSFESKF